MKESNYTPDDEGRLASVVAGSNLMTTFLYDGLGRLRKQLQWSYYAGSSTNCGGGSSSSGIAVVPASAPGGGGSGSGWKPAGGTLYIYDGMRVIQERDTNNTPTVSYTRGIDLSGTLEGAGGIGGLLARSADYSGGVFSQHDYYHADGQGNITYLADNTQSQAASYAYDPYGNLLSSAGTLATANTYRFSSREYVPSSGLYVYLYRFYNPSTERWLNQDPIQELGGINLYEFVGNKPVTGLDAYGLLLFSPCQAATDLYNKILDQAQEEYEKYGKISATTEADLSAARNNMTANCPDKPSPPPDKCPPPPYPIAPPTPTRPYLPPYIPPSDTRQNGPIAFPPFNPVPISPVTGPSLPVVVTGVAGGVGVGVAVGGAGTITAVGTGIWGAITTTVGAWWPVLAGAAAL